MNTKQNKVIYVHPDQYRMFYRSTIPASLPALVRRINYPLAGYYPEELTLEIIRNAGIVFMDIHWNYALGGAHTLAKRLKEVNPHLKIIAGGMTASMYPDLLISKFNLDYIIRGDGEKPLPMLVEALLDESDVSKVPNLAGKDGFRTEWNYQLSQAELDENEFYDLDFFPSYKQDIRKLHSRHFGWPSYVFPYLWPFRGCPMPCPTCAGGLGEQKKLFGRGAVIRSAERIASDIQILDANQDIRFVNVIHDFVSLMSDEYVTIALQKRVNLSLLYEFTTAPSKERLELLISKFKRGVLYFSLDKMHTQTDQLIDPGKLIHLIRITQKHGKFVPVLYYNRHFNSNPVYFKGLEQIANETKCLLSDVADWWEDFPKPDKSGTAESHTFQKFYDLSVKPKIRLLTKIKRWLILHVYIAATHLLPDALLMTIKTSFIRIFRPYHK